MSMPSSGKYTMQRSAGHIDPAYGKNNRLQIKSTNETKCRYLMKKLKKNSQATETFRQLTL